MASARPVSRDPRLKPLPPSQDQGLPVGITDPRFRGVQLGGVGGREPLIEAANAQQAASISTVLSDQLKQQLITKQAVTSTINKPSPIIAGSEFATTLNASNNDNTPNATLNNNNKTFSGNTNKDGVTHRASQKKDPRSSSNSSGNVNINSTKIVNSQATPGGVNVVGVGATATVTSSSTSPRGGGGNDIKSKDTKSTASSRGSSSSSGDKSSASSKSLHRKLGNKTRSKQPQASPSKITKVDRDCASPIRSKSRENDTDDLSTMSATRISPQSSSQSSSKSRKKSIKSRKRSPSPPYRIPRRNESKLNSSSNIGGGLTEEEVSGSLIVSPPHPPAFKEIRANTRQRNYVRRNKEDDASPEPTITVLPAAVANISEPLLESASKDEDLRSALPLPTSSASSTTVPEKSESKASILKKTLVSSLQFIVNLLHISI